MKPEKPSFRILFKYALLQIPGLFLVIAAVIVIRNWIVFPDAVAAGIVGVWIAKDVILFPFVWRSYGPETSQDRFAMIGRRGVALSRLDPDGYVKVRGETWLAEAQNGTPIEQGEPVRIERMEGLKAYVRRP